MESPACYPQLLLCRTIAQKHIQHKGWIGGWLMPQVGAVVPSDHVCASVHS